MWTATCRTPNPSRDQEFDMSGFARTAVIVAALLSSFAALSSAAGAVTWHNDGDTHFTATGGAGTLTSTGVSLGCSGSNTTATAPGGSILGTTLPVSGTIAFTGCASSGTSFGLHCGFTFTGTTWAPGTPAITSGNTDLTCDYYLATSRLCHFTGPVPSTYANPNGATPGKLVMTTGTALTVTNGSVGTCPLGNGDKVHQTQLTFNVVDATQPLGPVFTRTA
jgi:hypothetical protein